MVNYYGEIGSIIKSMRERRNMSKKQLAEGICSSSYISRIENGDRCPTSVILRQITNKLAITPEELFRAIESPTSLQVKNLIDRLFNCVERNDFTNIAALIAEQESHLQITSLYDLQIITALKHFSNAVLENQYKAGIEQLKAVLFKTYNLNSYPSDFELGIMGGIAHLMILDDQAEEAYEFLIQVQSYIPDINCVFTKEAIPRYYKTLTLASMDVIPISTSFKYIQSAIDYCKENNVHAYLRELYVVKAELYLKIGDQENYTVWINKAIHLHDLIKHSDDDYFETFLKSRQEHHKVM